MFKMGLLTSSAMTAVTLLLSAAPTGSYAQTDMHVVARDANARFLCTYGQFTASQYANSGGSFLRESGWEHVAVPVTGHGQTVSSIRVIEAKGRYTSTSHFSAGIYSNSPSGLPGKLIAGGKGRAPTTCGPVTIKIPPTTLAANTKYWIEETTPGPSALGFYSVYWYANPKTKHKAYVQKYWRNWNTETGSSSSSTTPWTKQKTGPYLKLR